MTIEEYYNYYKSHDLITLASNRTEQKIILKLNNLKNIDSFYNDVRKLTKNITSDCNIEKWQCFAEMRYKQLEIEELRNGTNQGSTDP